MGGNPVSNQRGPEKTCVSERGWGRKKGIRRYPFNTPGYVFSQGSSEFPDSHGRAPFLTQVGPRSRDPTIGSDPASDEEEEEEGLVFLTMTLHILGSVSIRLALHEMRRSARLAGKDQASSSSSGSVGTKTQKKKEKKKERRRVPSPPSPSPSPSPSPAPIPASTQAGSAWEVSAALAHLRKADPLLGPVLDRFGPPTGLVPGGRRSREGETTTTTTTAFASLARAVVGQQLSPAAAATIHSRFVALCEGGEGGGGVDPGTVADLPVGALREAGLSGRKANYLQDLAGHFLDGRLSDGRLASSTDSNLRASLTAVRGVGPWTCDMFLMFTLGRADILPVGDLGVRKGMAALQGMGAGAGTRGLPSPGRMEELAAKWAPYRSVGSWYMWRLADEVKTKTKAKGRK